METFGKSVDQTGDEKGPGWELERCFTHGYGTQKIAFQLWKQKMEERNAK